MDAFVNALNLAELGFRPLEVSWRTETMTVTDFILRDLINSYILHFKVEASDHSQKRGDTEKPNE